MDILDELFNNQWIWLIGGAIVMGLELVAPGVYLFWIGGGLITTGGFVAAYPEFQLATQIIIFIVSMLVWVLAGIYLQKRAIKTGAPTLNAGLSQYVGRSVLAAQDFLGAEAEGRASYLGRIKLEDTTYNAVSPQPVKKGQAVIIRAYQDGRFVVELGN